MARRSLTATGWTAAWRRIAAATCAIGLAMTGFAPTAQAKPLEEERCLELRDALEEAFDIRPAFRLWTESLDLAPLGDREVCRLSFRAPGVLFERPDRRGFDAAIATMRGALALNGWIETPAQSPFAQDAPLATRFAVTEDRNLCVVDVSLRAAAERLGQPEQVLPEWRLLAMPPVRRIYSFRLACVAPESR